MVALGIILTISVFLAFFLSGNRSEETPMAKAQPEVKKTATLVKFDAAVEFRERHNRARPKPSKTIA